MSGVYDAQAAVHVCYVPHARRRPEALCQCRGARPQVVLDDFVANELAPERRLGTEHESLLVRRQCRQGLRDQRVGLRMIDRDQHDAGELTTESREAALFPVATNSGDSLRERFDQAGAICADRGKEQRSAHTQSLRCNPAIGIHSRVSRTFSMSETRKKHAFARLNP